MCGVCCEEEIDLLSGIFYVPVEETNRRNHLLEIRSAMKKARKEEKTEGDYLWGTGWYLPEERADGGSRKGH